MEPGQLRLGIVLTGFGFLMLGGLIYLRLGYAKRWWARPSSVHAPGGEIYWGPPGAIILILMGIGVILPTLEMRQRVMSIAILCFPFTFIFLLWQPRFLTPAWLNWLRDNHGDVLPLLEKEAEIYYKDRTIKNWENQVATPEGLEAWVLDVRKKYGRLYDREWQIALKNPQLKIMAESDLVEAIARHPEIFGKQTKGKDNAN